MPKTVREAPLSIRLSKNERAALTRRAGGTGLSTYVKSVVLAEDAPRQRQRASSDQILLAQMLGQLGASGLALHLRRLSEAADSGSLHVDDLTVRHLHDACDDVRGMHLLLLKALGKRLPAAAPRKERVTVQFIRAAFDREVRQ